jgi:CelD/BcsL family acetyltransferase involved in cellulose biosynthesis
MNSGQSLAADMLIEPHAAACAPLRCRLAPITEELLAQWRSLERRIGNVPLAASAGWINTWLRIYGDLVSVRAMLAESQGSICGLALVVDALSHRAGPLRLRTRHVGTAGEPAGDSVCVEYNSVLVEPQHRDIFARLLVEQLLAAPGCDELRLDGFDADSVNDLVLGPGWSIERRASRFFDLQAAREAGSGVIERLGSSTRSQLRRTLRKYGTLDVQWAASLDEADDILSELVDLHQARWRAAGQPGAFASPRFLQFQRDLIVRLLPDERVALVRVRHQGETVGCLMLLNDQGRLLDYLSGFADFERKPSPGITSHYLCMEEALRRGFSAYDFLVGNKRHKENLSTDAAELVWAVHRRRSVKNRLITGLRRIKRTLHKRPGRPLHDA